MNEAIQNGSYPPPKFKKLDLIPRVAAALHAFTIGMNNVLAGHADIGIPTDSYSVANFTARHQLRELFGNTETHAM